MLQTQKTARTILAGLLAVVVFVSFYPAAAFAGTDYEAAYNQAKAIYQQKQAETASAYTAWQNAVTTRDNLRPAYDQAKAAAQAAQDAIEPAQKEVDRRHRILDYATRNAMNDLSVQAYTEECSQYASSAKIKEMADTDTRIANYTQTKTSHKDYSKLMQSARSVSSCRYGVTLSSSGNDDTDSVNWYQYCVYMGESYDTLMLTLEYFDENNQFRKKYESFMRSDEMRENGVGYSASRPLARVDVLVSPYLMVQAATNAPWNKGGHNALASYSYPGASAAQNLAYRWGDVDAFASGQYTYPSSDPFHGLFYAEEKNFNKEGWDSNGIGHYLNILGNNTHGGMACTYGGTSVFEQDFIYSNKATGYTVSQYRNMIDSKVSGELSAYNRAANAYEQAVADAEAAGDAADDAFDTYWEAKYAAENAKTAYDNAVTAEQNAKSAMDQAYQNWINSQNQGSQNQGGSNEPGTSTPTPGTQPGSGTTTPGTGTQPGTQPGSGTTTPGTGTGTSAGETSTQPTTPTPATPSSQAKPSAPKTQAKPAAPRTQAKPAPVVYSKSYVKSFKVSKGKRSFTARWKKQSRANQKKFSGYQIRYSMDKSMNGARYATAKKSSKSKKIKKLNAKSRYYVQVRTYTVTGGRKVYSNWTPIKAVTTK